MKRSPSDKKLEELLQSTKLVLGGFLGHDERSVTEIIDDDLAAVGHLGYSVEAVAAQMQKLTDRARAEGGRVLKEGHLEISVDEYMGPQICPWPHPGQYVKRVTTVKHVPSGKSLRWSDLNIHMIGAHGFFEGRGSKFRLEPKKLVKMIFERKSDKG